MAADTTAAEATGEASAAEAVSPAVAAAAALAAAGSNSRAFQATARRQRMCNTRAVGIVEQLACGAVPMQYLTQTLALLSKQHYEDAVTERSVGGACGFPLCASRLPPDPQPARRYRICPTTRKVYDVTRRKSYCSDLCFARSALAQDLIPDSPLWLRYSGGSAMAPSTTSASEAAADALSRARPRQGDLVSLDPVADDLERLRLRDASDAAADEAEADARPAKPTTTTAMMAVAAEQPPPPPSLAWLDRLAAATAQPPPSAPHPPSPSPSQKSPSALALSTAADWFTPETRSFVVVVAADRVRRCRGGGDTATATTLRLLSNETPVATAAGSVTASPSASGKIVERSPAGDSDAAPRRPMPAVDSACQAALRRRVVQEKLAAFVGAAAARLGLGLDCVSGDLRGLVDTFKLTSSNIALATSVWEILSWLVLLLLLRRRKDLRAACAHRLAAEAEAALARHRVGLATLLDRLDALVGGDPS